MGGRLLFCATVVCSTCCGAVVSAGAWLLLLVADTYIGPSRQILRWGGVVTVASGGSLLWLVAWGRGGATT